MPFPQQTSRFFSKRDIESLNANQMGVYGIFNQNQWIYVGKGDIKTRLLAHINGDNPLILKYNPAYWVAEVCSDPQMSIREKQLILELKPLCNQKVG